MKHIESEDENIEMFNYMKVSFSFSSRLSSSSLDLFDDKSSYKSKSSDTDDKFSWDSAEMSPVFFAVYLLHFPTKSCVFSNG